MKNNDVNIEYIKGNLRCTKSKSIQLKRTRARQSAYDEIFGICGGCVNDVRLVIFINNISGTNTYTGGFNRNNEHE